MGSLGLYNDCNILRMSETERRDALQSFYTQTIVTLVALYNKQILVYGSVNKTQLRMLTCNAMEQNVSASELFKCGCNEDDKKGCQQKAFRLATCGYFNDVCMLIDELHNTFHVFTNNSSISEMSTTHFLSAIFRKENDDAYVLAYDVDIIEDSL